MEVAALQVKNLTVYFDKKVVLKDVSFSVAGGSFTVLMGANGAGKTTLLRAICGNLHPHCGEIRIFERSQKSFKRGELSRSVAYVPQMHTPVFCYTLLDFVLMGTAASKKMYEQPTIKEIEKAEDIIRQLSLQEFIDTDYSTLSGGERRLALIARGIMQSAPVILLDEPTASLDLDNKHKIMEVLKKLSDSGTTLFVTMHDPNLACRYADSIVFLHEHRVLAALDKEKPDYYAKTEEILKKMFRNLERTKAEHYEVSQ